MITQCPYKIDNNNMSEKVLFACWCLKVIPELHPAPSTKEIYDFLKSSGVSWNSFQNICQFLTGKQAINYVEKHINNLPDNQFDLSNRDILNSFALAQAVCFPEKFENLMQSIECETGISRDEWTDEPKNHPILH